jgi:vacuolar-type H+-ATPase subunit I/STV1
MTNTTELQVEAESQLQQLLAQKKQITEFQSNVELMMQRHAAERSQFNLLAEWYGKKSWWIKASLGLGIASAAAMIGALSGLAIALSILIMALYTYITYLLQNDYNITLARDQRLKEYLQQMEQELVATVNQLSQLEDNLTQVFNSLCLLNMHMTEDIQRFEQQIAELSEQTQQLSDIIQHLNKTDTSLYELHPNYFSKARLELNEFLSFNQTIQSDLTALTLTQQQITIPALFN